MVFIISGCKEYYTAPPEYGGGKWPGRDSKEIHEVLIKNGIKNCNRGSNDDFYVFKPHIENEGDYLVDCRKWYGRRVYKVNTLTAEATRVY